MSGLPLHLLPRTLREIADYCGERVALLLLQHYGGGHLHVPANPGPDHRLTELLGVEDAQRLCGIYGGETISIPRAAAAMRQYRNAKIRRARADGATQFDLCREFGLTERQILTILHADDPPPPQYDLFGDLDG